MTDQPPPGTPAPIMAPGMCLTHRVLLVRQVGYGPQDPWRALEITATIVLFQAATCDEKIYAEVGGDVTKIAGLGCLACRKPDAFGQIVEAAKLREPGALKALGDSWVAIEKARMAATPGGSAPT